MHETAYTGYGSPENHPDCDRVNTLIYWGDKCQISSVAYVLGQPSAMLSRLVHLKLTRRPAEEDRLSEGWLHLFR